MTRTPKGRLHNSYKGLYAHVTEYKSKVTHIIQGDVEYDGPEGLLALFKWVRANLKELSDIAEIQRIELRDRSPFADWYDEVIEENRRLDEWAKEEAAKLEDRLANNEETKQRVAEAESLYEQNKSGLDYSRLPADRPEDEIDPYS